MYYKENWDEARQRLEALWKREVIGRCCVSVRAPKKGVADRSSRYPKPSSHEDLVRYHTDAAYVLERNEAVFESTYYAGEALPVLNPTWGDSGYAIYFSSNYKYSHRTLWFTPVISDWSQGMPEFNKETADRHVSFVREIAERAEGRFLLSAPDYIGNTDGLINLRGPENTMMDMLDEPEMFKTGLSEISKAVQSVGSRFFDIITKACCGGSAFAWYDSWARGRHNLVQCDFSVMISPEMFGRLVLPDLEESCKGLDCAVYHLDGQEQLRHLDMILSVKDIKMIQWTNVAGRPPVTDFIPVFKKIQKAGKGLLLFADFKQAEILLSELSSKGLYIIAGWADSEEDADSFIRKVKSLTRE